MFDWLSFFYGLFFGRKAAANTVVIDEAKNYTFTDANSDGNVVVEEAE